MGAAGGRVVTAPRPISSAEFRRRYGDGGPTAAYGAPTSAVAPTKRPTGERHESALYAFLPGVELAPGAVPIGIDLLWLRQYPWGAFLNPPRRFQADAAYPSERVLLEIEGGAHAVKAQRVHDVKRRQLAESAGWRVLSLLPEQVHDGSGLALALAALASPKGGA